MQIDLERLGGHVAGGDVGVDSGVHPERARRGVALARQLGDRLLEHLHVELEADRGHMAGLLIAEQLAGPA